MLGRDFRGGFYRYGAVGQETENEVSGDGNAIGFSERMLDTRLALWKCPDGATALYPGISPYAYVGNSPNYIIEKDGDFIGTLIGAIIGGYRAHKEGTSILKGTLKGAAAGAVADLTFTAIILSGGTATPLLIAGAGASAGFTGNLTDQLLDNRPGVDKTELRNSVLLGGVLGYGGGKITSKFIKYLSKSKESVAVGRLVEITTADDVNNVFKSNMLAQGVEESSIILPWKPGSTVEQFTSDVAEGGFVRFFGPKTNPNGDWIMKLDDVLDDAGNMLPFDQIRNKFAIPNEISGYKNVTIGEGVSLQKGISNGGKGLEGGGTQYQIIGGKENVIYE